MRAWSYAIVAVAAAILLGLSRLPHGAANRALAIVAMIAMVLVGLVWSSFMLTKILMPKVVEEARRRRDDEASPQIQKGARDV